VPWFGECELINADPQVKYFLFGLESAERARGLAERVCQLCASRQEVVALDYQSVVCLR
jgi:hypothetical protein